MAVAGGIPLLIADTFTLRLTAVMLVTETGQTDESNSPKRVPCAYHHAGVRGSGKCGTVGGWRGRV